MHIVFVHKTFPPQFAQMAKLLGQVKGWRSTFFSRKPDQVLDGLVNLQYYAKDEEKKHWQYIFNEHVRHAVGVMEALKAHPEIQPDLVVAHAGFGSSCFVPLVRDCPIINYFEYFWQPRVNDMLFRKEWKHPEWYHQLRKVANAMSLLDLNTCDSGYSPTRWQRSTFPQEHQEKIEILFDGVDTSIFRPRPEAVPRTILGRAIPPDTRIVTYVARGFELIRGFDIFMKLAKRIYQERPNTIFLVAGKDQVCYGSDAELIGKPSFKQWVLEQDEYDLSKFMFLDWLPTEELVRLFHLSDLHLYLTTPFIPSWSLFNALACGTTVLASDVAPVREVIKDKTTGLLEDFYDIEGLTARSLEVLADPKSFHPIGAAGVKLMEQRYSLTAMLPKFIRYFESVAKK